ncbi:mitochondrial fission ELM1 family protein [uncultured Ferrovibrio sp.]|jgi:mitochondrial fission protein ELM1|uniref:mitochondrial fission ELM1 family protein n=1 Tax=uncultured Ferrovibrio sp. TaxID=1576913 RepID=UPI002635B3A2|nr:mitochondrial fission ELM1 family protein [uncultured Ferrovibrio sp.]
MLKSIWAVAQKGAAGMLNQSIGLAEALFAEGGFGLPQVFEIEFRRPYTWLPMHPAFASLKMVAPDSAPEFKPPWPDVLITCGRKSAMLAMAVRKASKGHTITIHIQNPRSNPKYWDLVIVPEHDRMRGRNVIVSQGALHRLTDQKLRNGAEAIRLEYAHIPRPRVAVLVGGNNRYYTLDEEWMRDFTAQLRQMVQRSGCGILATISRRTGEAEANLLRGALASLPAALWDGKGPNPYFGFLGLADAIVVTGDSVSMVSEACFTRKPVMVAKLPGRSKRFDAFYESLLQRGLIQWFDGRLLQWDNGRLDETARIVAEVRQRFDWS